MANTKVVVAGVLFLLFSVSYASDVATTTTATPEIKTEEKTPEVAASVLDLARPSVQIFRPDASSSSDASTLKASFIPLRIDIVNIDGPFHELKGNPHLRFFRRHHRLNQRLLDWETLGSEHQGRNEGQESNSGAIEVVAGTEPVGRMIRFRFGGRRMGFHRGGGCPMMNKIMKELSGKNGIQLQFHGDLQEKKGEEEGHHHRYHHYHHHGDHDDDEKKNDKKSGIMKWFSKFLEQF